MGSVTYLLAHLVAILAFPTVTRKIGIFWGIVVRLGVGLDGSRTGHGSKRSSSSDLVLGVSIINVRSVYGSSICNSNVSSAPVPDIRNDSAVIVSEPLAALRPDMGGALADVVQLQLVDLPDDVCLRFVSNFPIVHFSRVTSPPYMRSGAGCRSLTWHLGMYLVVALP